MKLRLNWAISVIAGLAAAIGTAAAQGQTSRTATEINITSDSAPGWRPSESQRRDVITAATEFFSDLDEGQYERAYAMMAEPNRRSLPVQQFVRQSEAFHARSGALKQRTILKVTWTKDPPSGPFPGVFAAIDITSQYANVDRHCGFVVLYQKTGGDRFEVMRQESNFIDNATAQGIEQQKSRAELDKLWGRLAVNCPNYGASSPKIQ
jgi:hypothetical protein